jgi:hypothetical protein
MEHLPVDLHWNVQKFVRHPVAQIFLDALEKANSQLKNSILDIVYSHLIASSLNPPVPFKYTLVHRLNYYTGKW